MISKPGLKFKIPVIQNVIFYDNRLLDLDPPSKEAILNDQKRLEVDSFTRYRIVDPLKFYQTVQTEYRANKRLEEIVNSNVKQILGKVTLKELLSEKRTDVMGKINDKVAIDAKEIGVEVAEVRIRKADLPIQVFQAINSRMKAERERDAKDFRGQGKELAQQIRSKAEKESAVIISEAEKKAEVIKGFADKTAIKTWADVANKDAEFYAFYRSLEAYKNSIAEQGDANLVLSPDSEFFKYFGKSLRR